MKNFTLCLCITAMLAFLANTASAQSGYFGNYFTHTTSSANNDGGDGTILDNAAINSDSSKICIFTSVYGIYTPFNLGIYYNSPHWDIYQENYSSVPNYAIFNVLSPTMHGTSFVHTAAPATISGDVTYIDNTALNNNPSALVFFSHNYNPVNANYNYCNRTLGTWYDQYSSKWTLYTDDSVTAFPANTTFNIFAVDSGTPNAYVHVATPANTSYYITYLDHPFLNGNPNATIFVSYNWGKTGTNVYNHSESIYAGTAFNVLIADDIPTSITDVPNDYNLSIYPNPSSSSSNLKYTLKESALVDVKLMNSQGQEVASIFSAKQNAGVYSMPIQLSSLASGIYFCKFSVDGKVTTQSIVKQ